ncbi:MAG: hypothetical protein WKF43_08975 [Acidimicrobiales bacterium]
MAAETVRRPPLLGVGVVVWLSSELMFFAGLFGAYFTLRASTATWPPEGRSWPPAGPLATAVLVGQLHHAPGRAGG